MISRPLRVALPVPLFREFDYLPPASGPAPQLGARVRVPFGPRRLVGIVTDLDVAPAVAVQHLKAVDTVIDAEPLVAADARQLIEWTARYYHYPLGEVYAAALPAALRQGAPGRRALPLVWRLTAAGQQLTAQQPARAPRQRQVLAAIRGDSSGLPDAEARALVAGAAGVLGRLREHGWIEAVAAPAAPAIKVSPGPRLHAEQAAAAAAINCHLEGFSATLLQGVTGSGKTEVYLSVVEQVLARGRQALILVPEIGLTPQLVARFAARFGTPPVVLHSAVSPARRLDGWLAARNGAAPVVLGTRSAVFTPLARPGLIVVDEEHDGSYKQQDGLRYSARDVAVRRAQMVGIPIVLGSATPALESLQNVASGRYRRARLEQRAGGARPPAIALLDVRARELDEGLSTPLVERLRGHLDAGGQALLFLNRRGYAPALVCHDCGWIAPCRRCDLSMTVHRGGKDLRCHQCGAARPLQQRCETCGGERLVAVGEGTERVAAALRARLPGVPVARFDRDTTTRKGSLEELLAAVRSGEIRVLVGTQMLAKGHDFPLLTFVGVVNADHGLFSHDFRTFERMAQLVTQVAGRAGRGARAGEVMLQTRHPGHPLLNTLVRQGYEAYAHAALAERADSGMPPFGHLALLEAEAPEIGPPFAFLEAAATLARDADIGSVAVWGPAPAPLERRAGRYRAQLLLHAERRPALQQLLRHWVPQLGALPTAARVRWALEVDPMDSI